MEWDSLKNQPEVLAELVNETSALELADRFGLYDHKAVTYHLKKHDYYYNGSRWTRGDKAGEKEAQEERLPDKQDLGDYWVIRSGDREFEISKAKYKEIRRDYSGKDYLTINQICRKHQIPRWKFTLLRNAFGFTHDDVPYTDEEVLSDDPEELAEKTLQKRKDQYFKKLREKEIDNALKELDKYRQEEYWINRMHEMVTDHFKGFKDRYDGPLIPVHNNTNGNLMLEVPIVDLHLSKLCWEPETGENFDRNVAEARFMKVIHDVYQRCENLEIDKILFPIGNDYFNFDDTSGNTTRGTRQDNDSRWQKMFGVGVELLVKSIDILGQLAPIDTFVVPGNHDKQASYYAMMYLSAYYQNSDAISVDTSPKTRKYREFGKCLIGFSHMNNEKSRIYGNMQAEVPKIWGRTKYREWHGAHLHSEQVKEKHGVIVRNLSSITANDAWHYEKGYISQTKNQSFIWHKEKGLRNILITPIG